MTRSDSGSKGREQFETTVLGMQVAADNQPPAQPVPKFECGEIIIQWWAPWLKDAAAPPKTYKGKQRPAWFKGEVLGTEGLRSIHYAGILNSEQHCYHVY